VEGNKKLTGFTESEDLEKMILYGNCSAKQNAMNCVQRGMNSLRQRVAASAIRQWFADSTGQNAEGDKGL
jgi:hypothetical protein